MLIGSRNGTWNKMEDLVKQNEIRLNLVILFLRKILLKQAEEAERRKQIDHSKRVESLDKEILPSNFISNIECN